MSDNAHDKLVHIEINGANLEGNLVVPKRSPGIVIFAHGSGSSRQSPRNQFVAKVLQKAGLSTLLFDLLSVEEERIDAYTAHLRFDIGLLAQRLVAATEWLTHTRETKELEMGYFGASTGAAAALVAAATQPERIRAVVSRGGRPDLAGSSLANVKAPTLLIVGGDDIPVIYLNEQARKQMRTECKIAIIPGASHLFEEPGKLEEAAKLAANWFSIYLKSKKVRR